MSANLFRRLKRGQPLTGLGLAELDGRLLIAGVSAPQPETEFSRKVAGLELTFTHGDQHIKHKSWKNLHFRDCDFSNVALFFHEIENCVFEKCKCEELGLWTSHVRHTSFDRCNLRSAALGGNDIVKPDPRNEFTKVNFQKCDMRGTVYSLELFESCTFENCKLTKVDFQGCVFRNCTFIGPLDEVFFRRVSPYYKYAEPNLMENVDFSKADVTWCSFVGIDMRREWFGQNDDVIFLNHGPQDWRTWLGGFAGDSRFPGLDILFESVMDCGTPGIASRKFLQQCGFTQEEIGKLAELGSEP